MKSLYETLTNDQKEKIEKSGLNTIIKDGLSDIYMTEVKISVASHVMKVLYDKHNFNANNFYKIFSNQTKK